MNSSLRPPEEPLGAMLDRWGEAPACAPLSPDIRRRLRAVAREEATAADFRVFTRPAFAAVFLAACVMLGLFLAELRVTERHRARDAQLLASYRQLIDPLFTVAPAPPGFRTEAAP